MRTTRNKKIIDLVKHKNMVVSSALEFEVTKVFDDLSDKYYTGQA